MKVIIVYATLVCSSIIGMEEFNSIKALLGNPTKLALYLESQDKESKTPLMRLLDKGTDTMLEEVPSFIKGL